MPRLDLDQIAELYADGATIAELADRFGLSQETLRRRMAEANIPRRRRGPPVGKYRPADGRIQDKGGYLLLRDPGHPNASVSGYVRAARAFVAEVLGRPLSAREVVAWDAIRRGDPSLDDLRVYASASELMSHLLVGNSRALGDVGNPRRTVRRSRTPEEMLAELRVLSSELGRSVRRSDLVPPWPSYKSLARQFGTWQVAVATAIGSPPPADRQHPRMHCSQTAPERPRQAVRESILAVCRSHQTD
ncbi:MAG: hypothetical protein KJ048_15430 [Dehalococcoidia bacterium]|nr:hypothetical protein [Dehalococcoidia bacterium]